MDYHPTRLQYHKILIYEPCNYVSNVAYYRVFTSIADHSHWHIDSDNLEALLGAFATLSFGSAFYHASRSYLRDACDNNLITAIFYPLYQASVKNLDLPQEVREISKTPRSNSPLGSIDELLDLLSTKPSSEWLNPIKNIDMPHFKLSSAGIVTLPDEVVDAFLAFLLTNFLVSNTFQ